MRAPTMERQLLLTRFLERAERHFGGREVVSWSEGGADRRTWSGIAERVRRLAGALRGIGVEPGDRVATLAWNHHRHLELYFAVPALGAVLHTVNPRLSRERIGRILADGGARIAFADPDLLHLLPAGLRAAEHEELVRAGPAATFPELSEWSACGLCHTSGTTGEPKGVLYSHRALVLHAMGIALPDGFGIGERDTVLPAVPMFHASAWGLPYAAAMAGAGLVLPGPRPSARAIARLLSQEQVTFAAGVPMVWNGVLDELRRRPRPLADALRIHSGGAPSPPAMVEAYREELGIEIIPGWGMTELSPVGAVALRRAGPEGGRSRRATPLPLVEARLTDGEARERPWDGETAGELEVRGPWVAGAYAGRSPSDDPDAFRGGWLRTGDIATMDAGGGIRIVDRSKDLVRSGGEWISSAELENEIAGVAGVAEAAVVAMPDDQWEERPCAFVVARSGSHAASLEAEISRSLEPRFPRWWLPDRFEFVDALPRTATGKLDKRRLRRAAASLQEPSPQE